MATKRTQQTQTLEFPDDIRPDVLQSPLILALCRLRGGDVVAEASDDLTQVLHAAGSTGKKSTLTIKLEAKPNGRGKVIIIDDVAKKLPKPDKGTTALYLTERGQLVPFDPDQMEIDLKVVPVPDLAIKKA